MSRPFVLRSARLIDPASGLDEIGDVRVEDGRIAAIGERVRDGDAALLECEGLVLAPALIDLCARVSASDQPRGETVESLARAGAAGGVGTVAITGDSATWVETPDRITSLLARGGQTGVRVLVAGAMTNGRALAEMGLMARAGASFLQGAETGFSLRRQALAYAGGLDLLCAVRPDEPGFEDALFWEGELAARLGVASAPEAAERLAAERDLALAELTGARLMLDRVATREALEPLARAKAKGLEVFGSVGVAHLSFNEIDAGGLNPAFRMTPPLAGEASRRALVQAVADGLIDAIVSDHCPRAPEEKDAPFGEAAPGSANIEMLLPALLALVADGQLTLLQALAPVTSGPALILGLEQGRLAEGAPADLVLFDTEAPLVCRPETLRGQARNTAYAGRRLHGAVRMTLVNGAAAFRG